MYKSLLHAFVLVMLAQNAVAQIDGYEVEVEDSEINMMKQEAPVANTQQQTQQSNQLQDATQAGAQAAPVQDAPLRRKIVSSTDGSQNKIYILNNQNATSNSTSANRNNNVNKPIQEQTSTVEANALSTSKAANLRKSRENIEINTEQKIVEKLEESRIRDEKSRADRLFGDRFDAIYDPYMRQEQKVEQNVIVGNPAPVVAAPVAPLAPVEPAPQKVEVLVKTEPVKEAVSNTHINQNQIHNEVKIERESPKSETKDRSYVAADGGLAQYVDAVNVKGNGAMGLALGYEFSNRFSLEGRFKYSSYSFECLNVNNPAMPNQMFDLNQYNFVAGARFRMLDGKFSPVIGGNIGYTLRNYAAQKLTSDYDAKSNAFDAGVVIGAELKVNDGFTVGLDFNYNKNVAYNTNTGTHSQVGSAPANALESFDYYFVTLGGKFMF